MVSTASKRSAHLRRLAALAAGGALAGGTLLALANPASAMGTGNPYEDQQVGVTYTVYQPSYTAGLATPTTAANAPQCPKGTEENLVVKYGTKGGLAFTVYEGNPICSDPGEATQVLARKVGSATAKVFAYCDVEVAACMKQDVKKQGGYLLVTLPGVKPLKQTSVEIETSGTKKLSAHQLVRVARSLAPVQ